MRVLPPTVSGARPFVGHTLEFLRDPASLMDRGYREHGNISTIRVGGRPLILVAGLENARTFFDQTDNSLSIRDGMAFLSRLFTRDFYFLAEPSEYQRQREILLPRFQSRQLDGYVKIMDKQAAEFLTSLGHQGEFDLLDELGPVAMRIAAEAFLGASFGEGMGTDLFAQFRLFSAGIDPVMPGWVPLPHLVRGRRARRWLRAAVTREIQARRAHPADPPDFLQQLTEARYSDGTAVPDDIRVSLVLGLIWAGHETTVGQLAWAVIDLLRHPAELDKARAEQRDVLPLPDNGPVDMKAMRRLGHLGRALDESQRLHPAAFGIIRSVTEDTKLAGYVLPKGSRTLLSTKVTHRLPELFDEPDAFRPDRYLDAPKVAHQLIGFGGGMHRCLGRHFANLEMQVLITRLLQALDLELIDPDPQRVSGMRAMWPQGPCRVRYRRQALGA